MTFAPVRPSCAVFAGPSIDGIPVTVGRVLVLPCLARISTNVSYFAIVGVFTKCFHFEYPTSLFWTFLAGGADRGPGRRVRGVFSQSPPIISIAHDHNSG